MSAPRLVPLPPHAGRAGAVDASPYWIGSAAGSSLVLPLPGIAERHVAIVERENGHWISPVRVVRPAPALNGIPLEGPAPLRHGDVLELLPGITYRFDAGVAIEPPPPRAGAPPPGESLRARRRPRPRPRLPRLRLPGSLWACAGLVGAIMLVGAGVALAVYALTRPAAPSPLSEDDAIHFDSLLLASYDHVERGTTLLELGLADPALREFARAINTLETSRLHENPWVRPRIETLEGAIATIYREKRVSVPAAYREAAPRAAPPLPAVSARLSAEDFAARFAEVQRRFEERYGRRLVVTGRDHAEHVSLYGEGGALDLRVRDLSRDQIRFAVERLREVGIRVKDFSTDEVLQAQIASARAAGLLDRAGTGLHLHIDRYTDRSDRWTVR